MKRVLSRGGFTIVELLVVIVVIAVLAAISVVAYSGVQRKATESAVSTSLSQVARQIDIHKAEHGNYPASLSDIQVSGGADIGA